MTPPIRSKLAARAPRPLALAATACALWLAGCATGPAGGPTDDAIPADAVESTRTESNGDVITEYRVAGRLRALKVTPSRGPTYYLYDRNDDGVVDGEVDGVQPVYFKLFEWD